MDSLITETELLMLEACRTAEDWDRACDAIKLARDGQYPSDWWAKVKLTGRMDRIMARWGADSELRAYRLNPDGTRTEL